MCLLLICVVLAQVEAGRGLSCGLEMRGRRGKEGRGGAVFAWGDGVGGDGVGGDGVGGEIPLCGWFFELVDDVLLDEVGCAGFAEVRFARLPVDDVRFVDGRLVIAAVALHGLMVHEDRGLGKQKANEQAPMLSIPPAPLPPFPFPLPPFALVRFQLHRSPTPSILNHLSCCPVPNLHLPVFEFVLVVGSSRKTPPAVPRAFEVVGGWVREVAGCWGRFGVDEEGSRGKGRGEGGRGGEGVWCWGVSPK